VKVRFYSQALHENRSYLVYEPPGYDAAVARGKRFPALYLLHGSPGNPHVFINVARAGVTMDEAVAAGTMRPFLLVMPNGDDGSLRKDTEWANTPHGNYESFVLDVVRSADSRFNTIRKRLDRGLAGDSEGGYAALNIALHHLGTFGLAESWSGYLNEPRDGVFKDVPAATLWHNEPPVFLPRVAMKLLTEPLHVFLYKGSKEHAFVKRHMAAFAARLRGYGADARFAVYPGGHDWRLWRKETPRMLAYASHAFGRAKP
jgi:enterochelin esterase-like enzyme